MHSIRKTAPKNCKENCNADGETERDMKMNCSEFSTLVFVAATSMPHNYAIVKEFFALLLAKST